MALTYSICCIASYPDDVQVMTCEVETPAEYPGGPDALMKFLSANITYPESCSGSATGRLIARFNISETGKISDIEIIKKLDPTMDKEIIRVISIMPDWIPAKHGDDPVSSSFVLPVNFKDATGYDGH